MRVLVVDQDSASNLAITRSLKDLYSVDCVTNKGDCLGLLRSNTFEVIVATERLEDGSGLELLGQISKKWPAVLRIFAADRERLQLLRGRLGPFELFQTLTYPIDAERLIATLSLAAAAQNADADTSDIQHVELSGELAESVDSAESAESEDFPAPRPAARVAPMEHAQAASRGGRATPRVGPAHRSRPAPVGRPRRNGAAGAPTTRGASSPSGTPWARGPSGGTPRPERSRGTGSKAPPVRFPPLDRVPAAGRTPPLEAPQNSPGSRAGAASAESLAEAAAMARAARSDYEPNSPEFEIKRRAVIVGGGVAAVLLVVFLGFKIFGSKNEAPRPAAPPVTHAPQFPQETTDLIAKTEQAFKADDFKAARADVDQLRQISPLHPRLAFFESLLAAHADGARSSPSGAAGVRGGAKKNGPPSHRNGSSTVGATPTDVHPNSGSPADVPSADSPALAPETPVGFSRATAASGESQPTDATISTPEPGTTSIPGAATGAAQITTPAAAPATASTSSSMHRGDGEPPPVIREAKLIRRVNPDYPSAARKDGLEGSVDLAVTVSTEGVVEDISVVQGTPPGMFEKSALAAVRKWKYDPRFVDGLPSQAHLKVHLDFGPDE
jgi:TonB family protein